MQERDADKRQARGTLDCTHHVVSVLVLDALEHVSVQLAHHLLLLLGGDGLQRLLDDAAAVHLQREVQHVPAHLTQHTLHIYISINHTNTILCALRTSECAPNYKDPQVFRTIHTCFNKIPTL